MAVQLKTLIADGTATKKLRSEKIISFFRQNLSYGERYFAEKFEEHDLTDNVAYTCDDTFSPVSLISAGLGIGFAVADKTGREFG